MKKLTIIFFLIQAFTLQAEELLWFDINCNLRSADYIIEGRILDKEGKIAVVHDYSQEKVLEEDIRIEKFGSPENFAVAEFYEDLIGRSIIMFIKYDSTEQKLKPAWFAWELSTLWIEGETLKSAFQPANPGGWWLKVFYKNKDKFEIEISNWDVLNKAFLKFKDYNETDNRLNYLSKIFSWHPFKYEIIREIKKEKELAPKYLKIVMLKLYYQRLSTKAEICRCVWFNREENIYPELFLAFKETSGIAFQKGLSDIINNLKYKINNIKSKKSSEINEEFIIEFIDFINSNPVSNWEDIKEELRNIVKSNSQYYNKIFLERLEQKLK